MPITSYNCFLHHLIGSFQRIIETLKYLWMTCGYLEQLSLSMSSGTHNIHHETTQLSPKPVLEKKRSHEITNTITNQTLKKQISRPEATPNHPESPIHCGSSQQQGSPTESCCKVLHSGFGTVEPSSTWAAAQ